MKGKLRLSPIQRAAKKFIQPGSDNLTIKKRRKLLRKKIERLKKVQRYLAARDSSEKEYSRARDDYYVQPLNLKNPAHRRAHLDSVYIGIIHMLRMPKYTKDPAQKKKLLAAAKRIENRSMTAKEYHSWLVELGWE
jgi:hypothetical protein